MTTKMLMGLGLAASVLAVTGTPAGRTTQAQSSSLLAPQAIRASTVEPSWREAVAIARRQVARESPAAAFPFRTASGGSGTLIAAHYFPPFPISLDNRPASGDYYAVNYLRPEGEGGRYRATGGFLRQRPLGLPAASPALKKRIGPALEIARAERIVIDAFTVDILGLNRGANWDRTMAIMDAADAANTVRIIPQPDMVAMKSASAEQIADLLSGLAKRPSLYRLRDGRMLVSPYGAEAKPVAFWKEVLALMERRDLPVALMPVFVNAGPSRSFAPVSVGMGIWGGRDAKAGEAHLAAQARARTMSRWAYFMPVSPQDARPKYAQFHEARNSEAYRGQWRAAIDSGAEAIHLLTWNDYSETTEIAPSSFSQFIFYDLTAYHIAWARAGRPPTITRDALFLIHRRQIVQPMATERGRSLSRKGATPLANEVEVLAFLKAPAVVRLRLGKDEVRRQMPAGLHSVRIAAAPGRPEATIERGGNAVVSHQSPWTIDANANRHDVGYGGSSSLRPLARVP